MSLTVLGLDLGTRTGWAILRPDGSLESGQWDLPKEPRGARYVALRREIDYFLDLRWVIAYEDVTFHTGVRASHVYGGLLAVVEMVAFDRGIHIEPVNVAAAKTRACGKTHAKKDDMVRAARERWGRPFGPDEADAAWIATVAVEKLLGSGA